MLGLFRALRICGMRLVQLALRSKKSIMKAIVLDRFGDPAEVLQVRDLPVPEPGPGQVRVRMIASPINPSDLMMARGLYGIKPALPATPGFEGVGVVEANGGGLLGRWRLGKRVAVLNGQTGNWQEQVIVPARQVVPIPASLPDEQAATFFVNPASALVMVRHVLKVPRGAWLLQTAAGSALGRMVIRLGKLYGFRTINVVRRREQKEDLLRAGADSAICSNEEAIDEQVRRITGGAGVPFAIDPVGGATASAVVKALGPNGRMLVYGTLSEEPMSLDPRALMGGHKTIEGFWLSEWIRKQGVVTLLLLFRRLKKLFGAGVVTSDVAATFPLDQIKTAVERARQPGRSGKVLLRIGSG
jgi:NADPH:quinone reductase-like Zn-dependent oxidoreductase